MLSTRHACVDGGFDADVDVPWSEDGLAQGAAEGLAGLGDAVVDVGATGRRVFFSNRPEVPKLVDNWDEAA